MGFCINPGCVRVDRWKPQGKWYDTWEVDMTPFWNVLFIHSGVAAAIMVALERSDMARDEPKGLESYNPSQWWDVLGSWNWTCLKPYHRNSHPVMLRYDSFNESFLDEALVLKRQLVPPLPRISSSQRRGDTSGWAQF
jgi:hypothetical protein